MRIALIIGAGIWMVCAPRSASAFCRTMSCELTADGSDSAMCERDANGCVIEGNPLHWPSPCIHYAVQRDGSPKSGIDGRDFEGIVKTAFEAWEHVTCQGGGNPRFHAQSQGFVSCDHREAVCGDTSKNVNVVMLHDESWPGSAAEIGLTTPTGGPTSGLLIDADLELNSETYDFTAGAANGLDISDVITHEVGHFLGLSHSNVSGALMSKDYATVRLTSELFTEDDVAAICAAYPPGAALACPAPPAPAYDECQLAPGERAHNCKIASMTHDGSHSGGCSIGAPGAPSPLGPVTALLLGLLFRFRARRQYRDGASPNVEGSP